jgi:LPS sulfotransferase NodH
MGRAPERQNLAYVICTSPRSGSTLLCKGLTRTHRAGAPDEFFDHRAEVSAYWMHRFGIAGESDYADGVIDATTTSNGVFGAKLHWTTLLDMRRALRDSACRHSHAIRHGSLDELLHARFSTVRYIWLRRNDKVAQGISHFRAAYSNRWEIPNGHVCATDGAADTVAFDRRMIGHCIGRAHEYDREWESHFKRHGLTPMQLVYEDLVASYDPTLRKVLDFLEIPHSDLPGAEPQIAQMSDAKSLEWANTYREVAAEAPAGQRAQDIGSHRVYRISKGTGPGEQRRGD